MKDPYTYLKYPLSTEKAVRLMESENKIIFVVDEKAKKPEIKTAVENAFKVKVLNVNTSTDSKGKKRAYITLSPENPAIDIATQLGII